MIENPSAFPGPTAFSGEGMSLRDWFAGRIAASLCSATDNTGMWTGLVDDSTGYAMVAERSYKMADAMLAARQKGGEA